MTDIEVLVRDSLLYDTQAEEQLLTLFFPKRTITCRELIRERVLQGVKAYNDRLPDIYQGMIAPAETERVPNGYKILRKRTMNPEQQCQRALEAFERNGFILLVDDRQVCQLDEQIEIRSGTQVVFLKLTPLVGG